MLISQWRSFFSACLLAVALCFSTAFVGNFSSAAIAYPLTPEVTAYEIAQASSPDEAKANLEQKTKSYKKELRDDSAYTKKATKEAVSSTKNALERSADNVRDKLNLDEPLPQSTKDFLNDVTP